MKNLSSRAPQLEMHDEALHQELTSRTCEMVKALESGPIKFRSPRSDVRRLELLEMYKEQPKISLGFKNFKVWEAFEEEDNGFCATLYINNKRVAHVIKNAFEDELHIRWIKSEYEELLEAYIVFLPLWESDEPTGLGLWTILDLFLIELAAEHRMWLKRGKEMKVNRKEN